MDWQAAGKAKRLAINCLLFKRRKIQYLLLCYKEEGTSSVLQEEEGVKLEAGAGVGSGAGGVYRGVDREVTSTVVVVRV
eukprot:1189267-Prorocentrum_minimum.AAC.3